jgi:hypothetical protein
VNEEIDIEIGDGSQSCTQNIKYYNVTLKGTGQKVVLIDTPGLD